VALAGNPNTGKTTIFNALTGFRARVANYPGVTVDKKSGPFRAIPGATVLDLPGTYSLAARSPDEAVAADVLLGRRDDTPRPDAVVVVTDASNLERNLYLASQVLETGVPAVLALNMMDTARERGHEIDVAALSSALGLPVVPVVASRGEGLDALAEAVRATLARAEPPRPLASFPAAFEREVEALAGALDGTGSGGVPAFERRRMLLDVGGHSELRAVARGGDRVRDAISAARMRLASAGTGVEGLEATVRYGAVGAALARAVRTPDAPPPTATDRIDAVLTHRVFGLAAFAAVMTVVFVAIYTWAAPAMDFLEGTVIGGISAALADSGVLGGGAVESLVVDGLLGGVGSVVVFLPQIAILFAFLAVLEDCGYLARAAFLMDRLLRGCGLSGKSFIPMLSSFACAVPGIMAARAIESRRDRLATILVAPLMSCSARLPVYTLLVAAFVPAGVVLGFLDVRGLVFAALYLLGLVVAIPVAFLLKRTLLRGESSPFVMELPPYRRPSLRAVARRSWDASKAFLVRAGTLIFATMIVIWALSYFPRPERVAQEREAAIAATDASVAAAKERGGGSPEAVAQAEADAEARKKEAEAHARGEYGRASYMGRLGKAVEPVFAPMGWDWRVSAAVLASFPAREVVVGTLGTLYDLAEEDDEEASNAALRDKVVAATWDDGPRRGQPVFDLASALALVVFFALCMQCASTLVVMWKETGSWGWPAFAFVYMTALAYFGAWATAAAVRALS
jgi:ferrous iron transport protein B